MSDVFYINQGDTTPEIQTTLTDPNGDPADVTGASIQFKMAEARGGDSVIDAAGTIVNGTQGEVRYDWSSGDTDSPGRYRAVFEVTYTTGEVETFPNTGYETVYITENVA